MGGYSERSEERSMDSEKHYSEKPRPKVDDQKNLNNKIYNAPVQKPQETTSKINPAPPKDKEQSNNNNIVKENPKINNTKIEAPSVNNSIISPNNNDQLTTHNQSKNMIEREKETFISPKNTNVEVIVNSNDKFKIDPNITNNNQILNMSNDEFERERELIKKAEELASPVRRIIESHKKSTSDPYLQLNLDARTKSVLDEEDIEPNQESNIDWQDEIQTRSDLRTNEDRKNSSLGRILSAKDEGNKEKSFEKPSEVKTPVVVKEPEPKVDDLDNEYKDDFIEEDIYDKFENIDNSINISRNDEQDVLQLVREKSDKEEKNKLNIQNEVIINDNIDDISKINSARKSDDSSGK